jgi:hypothetical protein
VNRMMTDDKGGGDSVDVQVFHDFVEFFFDPGQPSDSNQKRKKEKTRRSSEQASR